jgi:alkylation response protein AidB-like acyl-CoA dehydrogenase
MDLAVPAVVERAARTAREFVESYLLSATESGRRRPDGRGALTDLAPVIAASSLAHVTVFRELGRVPAPWGETVSAAGLQFHDLARAGVRDVEAGAVGLALGDPRRRPERDAVGVRATERGDAWELQGVALLPGYVGAFDSLLVAAALAADRRDVGLFFVPGSPAAATSRDPGLIRVVLDRTRAELLQRGEAAWEILLALRRRERLSQIALAVGAAQRAHEASLAAARDATAAKDPLALGQGVQFQVADDAIDLQVAETLALHCATLADAGALSEADLALTRFMVLDAFERIALRAAHVTALFAPAPPPWARFVVDLARSLKAEGGAVELDRRDAALGLLPTA